MARCVGCATGLEHKEDVILSMEELAKHENVALLADKAADDDKVSVPYPDPNCACMLQGAKPRFLLIDFLHSSLWVALEHSAS